VVYFIIIISVIIFGILLNMLSNKLIVNYYNKTSKIDLAMNITSHELIIFFIRQLSLNIFVKKQGEGLENSYNIKTRTICLSNDVYNSSSLSAITISMHELGHALQHNTKSILFHLFVVFSVLNKITSTLLFPAILFLVVSLFLETIYLKIAIIIIFCFYIINLISRIIIIPLEKNASNKAIKLMKEYKILNASEQKIAQKLLNLACFTYIGGFFKNYRVILKKILRGF